MSLEGKKPFDNYRRKVIYDRIYDRIIGNTKILNAAGMKQSELKPLYEDLESELQNLPENIFASLAYSERMDRFIAENKLK